MDCLLTCKQPVSCDKNNFLIIINLNIIYSVSDPNSMKPDPDPGYGSGSWVWIYNYLCTYVLYRPVRNVFYAGENIWRGVGPGNQDFFGPCEMARAEIYRAHPPRNVLARIKKHYAQGQCCGAAQSRPFLVVARAAPKGRLRL